MTHSLSSKDLESKMAQCSICGPVKIRQSGTGWVCAVKENANNRKHHRRRNLLNRFKLTIDDFNNMLSRQNYVCAICLSKCKTGRELSVDHDHKTGKVRGLLCNNCNNGLGRFKDSPELLHAAAEYLEGVE